MVIPKIAFVSTSVSPYCVPARIEIDKCNDIISRHFFARKVEPGREWTIGELPKSFEVVSGFTLKFFRKFLYVPILLPFSLWRFKPDIIVSEQLGTLLVFTLLYAKFAGVPVLLRWEGTVHTEKRYSSGFRNIFRKSIASLVQGFLYYSEGAKQYLQSLGVSGCFCQIPYSVNDELYHPSSLNRNKYAILYVGQLVERKGVEYLLRAFPEILLKFPQAELWVVGNGEQKDYLSSIIVNEIKPRVKWYGFISENDVSDLMKVAGVFVCPTLEDHGPLVQIEAARCGLPIVGSIYSGNVELVVEEGVNGYVVDPENIQDLTNGVINILCSDKYLQMHARSVELSLQHSPENEAKRTISAVLDYLDRVRNIIK